MNHKRILTGAKKIIRTAIYLFILLIINCCINFSAEADDRITKLELGEKLSFDIDVLFLKKVAVGTAILELIDKDKLIFKATVEAKIVRFFLERRNVYLSVMQYIPEKKRFKPISFTETKYKGGSSTSAKTYYDIDKGVVVIERFHDGKLYKTKERAIKETEFYDDIVTAFYNMRIEAYGKVEEGKNFIVRSMHRDGKFYFSIDVLDDRDNAWLFLKESDCLHKNSKYFVEILTPKEVFDAQGGRLFIGFTQDLIPNFVFVRKVLGIGNLKGRLVKASNPYPSD
jgi:hypothetical protein